ncbi:MAG: DNA phosphorothioation-associated putative methyltransferase, partial [Bdellovibrionaceae bacterium]|nr:DNA phosphorothioation-associated putative methyltransferase [Pseudobdellovibrionaceae bacterium]
MNQSMHEFTQNRHKTALKRVGLSRPIVSALRDRIIRRDFSIFDYGCGHGIDIEILSKNGFEVSGFDPYYRPDSELKPSDIVNLGFVLNVIERQEERVEVLKKAYSLAQKALIVAVRVDTYSFQQTAGDGFVARSGAFQKIYSNSEIVNFCES